eukprot:COSAG04_NODE_872_length_9709_cov_20.683767_5_plen_260_part_00
MQLGHGDEQSGHTPKRVEALANERVIDLDCANGVTVAVTAAGDLYRWGDGPMTFDDRGPKPRKVRFPAGVKIRRASCSYLTYAAVDTEGVLYTWGVAEYHRLGHGGEWDDKKKPKAVSALAGHRVSRVSCGSYHTAAVTTCGQLWTWGSDEGELGRYPDWDDDVDEDDPPPGGEFPVRVTYGLPVSGTWGDCSCRLRAGARVQEVSCGDHKHTVIAMASGEVCTFGSACNGKLGLAGVDVRTGFRGGVVDLPRVVELPA